MEACEALLDVGLRGTVEADLLPDRLAAPDRVRDRRRPPEQGRRLPDEQIDELPRPGRSPGVLRRTLPRVDRLARATAEPAHHALQAPEPAEAELVPALGEAARDRVAVGLEPGACVRRLRRGSERAAGSARGPTRAHLRTSTPPRARRRVIEPSDLDQSGAELREHRGPRGRVAGQRPQRSLEEAAGSGKVSRSAARRPAASSRAAARRPSSRRSGSAPRPSSSR